MPLPPGRVELTEIIQNFGLGIGLRAFRDNSVLNSMCRWVCIPNSMADVSRLGECLLLAGGLVLLGFQATMTKVIGRADGCGWDGARYCAMFRGEHVEPPYSRRVLAPLVARLFGSEPVAAFQVMDLLVIVASVGVAVVLTRDRGRLATTGMVVVVLSCRSLGHFILSYPVITDPLALLLLLFAFAAFRWRRGWLLVAAVGAILPLARENYGVGLAAACIVLAMLWRTWTPLPGAVTAIVVTAGVLLAGSPGSSIRAVPGWMAVAFSSSEQVAKFVVALAVGIGWSWILLASPRLRGRLGELEWSMLSGAAAIYSVSVFGGYDTERILMPVGVLTALVAIRVLHTALIPWAVASYAVVQAPWVVVPPSDEGFLGFYGLRYDGLSDVVLNGVIPAALGLSVLLIGLLGVRQPDSGAVAVLELGAPLGEVRSS